MTKEPILITGIHRSGSTWIGKTISASIDVKYIHEPFNIIINWANPLRKFSIYTKVSPVKYWFEYIDFSSHDTKQRTILRFISSFYKITPTSVIHEVAQIRKCKDFKKVYYELSSRRLRPLIKDPLALMSSEFLYKKLNCKVIISIRHPAAFISSLIRQNWGFDFNHLKNQPQLIDSHLLKYKDEIEYKCQNPCSLIEQGILLWNIIYDFVAQLEDKYGKNSNWYFIRHEDISLNPLNEFEKIFDFLNLEFTEKIKTQIKTSTSGKIIDDLNRNSRSNIESWKNILDQKEINKIREKTRNVASKYYSEDTWQ